MRFHRVACLAGLALGVTSGTAKAAVYAFEFSTTSNVLGAPISADGRLRLTPDPDLDGAYLVDKATGDVDGSVITGLDRSFTPLVFDGPTGTDGEIIGVTTASGVTYDFARDYGLSSVGDLDRGSFRISAVPLPAAAALFGAALAALGLCDLRRSARSSG